MSQRELSEIFVAASSFSSVRPRRRAAAASALVAAAASLGHEPAEELVVAAARTATTTTTSRDGTGGTGAGTGARVNVAGVLLSAAASASSSAAAAAPPALDALVPPEARDSLRAARNDAAGRVDALLGDDNDDDESERGVGREQVQKGEEKWKTPVDPLRALRLARAHAVGSRAPSDFLAVADSAKYCDRKGRRAVWRFVRSVATPPPELPAGCW